MPISLFDIQPLLKAIEAGVLILTPNSRLKNKLIEAYNQHHQRLGTLAWQAPRAYALAEWLNEQYQQLLDRALLNPPATPASDFVLQRLWLDIIQKDPLGAELINPLRLASDAQTACRTLQRWNLDLAVLAEPEHADKTAPLRRWIVAFEELLQQHELCTAEQAEQAIIAACAQGQIPREPELLLLGFDDIPPLHRTLFDTIAMQVQSRATFDSSGSDQPSRHLLVQCPTLLDEIRAAACWAQSVLNTTPGASIGIIAPNLGQIRSTIEQIFVEVLEPQYSLPETARYTLPFNFSAGVPLGSVPLVHDTLSLLQLNLHRIDTSAAINLLSSPFWALADALEVAETLASQLKKLQRARIRTSQLRQLCHRQSERCETEETDAKMQTWQWLDQALQYIETLRRQRAARLLPGQWLELFESQLRHLGWPGSRRPDSNEFQQLTQWYQLQEKFCQLEVTGKLLSCDEALNMLTQLAGSEHFQAQTPDSPVQILGILEGAGLQFSHCWVLGMSQQNWPPAPEPNPLLPLSLQRQHAMPHADADRELAFAERLTAGYRHCAPQVVFSFPGFDGDTPLQPSALVKEFPLVPVNELLHFAGTSLHVGWPEYLQEIVAHQQLEWINTATGPAVSPGELTQLRGGSQILKNQAISPYSAFLLHRLGAQQPEPLATGFTAIQRGQILHDSLSDIWKELKDQQTLLQLAEDELKALVNRCVHEHIQRWRRREPDFFGETYAALEQQRQAQLILRWLEREKQRPPFAVVANEETIVANFAGLPLTLRLDRMDQLDNGELILIDYKTGTPAPKSWGGERPDEPQLPLYCLCYLQDKATDISAVMFAQINATEIAIKGLGGLSVDHPDILPATAAEPLELPPDWALIRDHWHRQLTLLATTFLQGDCSLDFKNPSLKRFYEDLGPILRWQEEDFVRGALSHNGGQN